MSALLDSLLGELDPIEQSRWEELQEGRIAFQRCQPAGHAWLPPRPRCPRCLTEHWEWETASGEGELVSWVVYHIALHPAFDGLVPYKVALVELAEGPRMVTRLRDALDGAEPWCGAPVTVTAVEFGGVMLAEARLQ